MMKICVGCGVEFKVKNSRSYVRFCTRECLSKSTVTLVCKICGKDFTAPAIVEKKAKYCSDYCRARSGPEEHECVQCGKLFYYRTGNKRVFCSFKCNMDSKRGKVICIECGKEITVPLYKSKHKFCGHECEGKFLSRKFKEASILKHCSNCGKEFRTKPSCDSHLCSKKCTNDYQSMRRDYPEPEPVEGARWIQLGKNGFVLVDEDKFDELNKHRWLQYKKYAYTFIDGKRIHMHRMLTNAPPRQEVDHKNANTLDNRTENLRLATRQHNAMNRMNRPDINKFRGVYVRCSGIVSMIKKNGVIKYIGSFKNTEDAARAYDKVAREMFGEFARLNFPDEGEQKA
jgi:hypothetical protein